MSDSGTITDREFTAMKELGSHSVLDRFAGFIGICLAAASIILSGWGCASAQSLWDPASGDLFMENRAHRIGDIVTILVEETAQATQKASTKTAGESKLSAGDGKGLMKWLKLSSANSSSDFNGDGETTRSGTIRARITASIVQKLPNGNLVLRGNRKIRVNRETQEIVVSGTARPHDITPENTVLSSYLADAEIKYKGEGSIGHLQKPGLLHKIVHFLF